MTVLLKIQFRVHKFISLKGGKCICLNILEIPYCEKAQKPHLSASIQNSQSNKTQIHL